jgi:NAD-dependent dihydropyrimidine dehydrogenase PreA subunit
MTLKYLKNVATLSFAVEKCISCGKCVEVCPRDVFDFADKKARIAQKDLCMECGACALNCPENAIEVSAGVGCASAVIKGWFTGGEPTCDCFGGECR